MAEEKAVSGADLFRKFRDWEQNRHEYAREWKKRTGGKVMGFFCTYAPEELMRAAGILPVRILGSHEPQDVTEPHIFAMYCPFCRDCLAQGLKGRYDYLDGIMISQSCLHIRQAFTSWQKHVPVDYSYYLPMPHHVQSPRAIPFLKSELVAFKKSLEEWTGKEIGDDALKEAIDTYNANRRMMKDIYKLRRSDPPPMTGEEAMEMVISNQMTDKAEHNEELKKLAGQLPGRDIGREVGVRLMVLGSENDDLAFIRMVESCGATFVTDDHCTGTRYFWNEVGDDGDLLNALAIRYVSRPPCPTKDWPERRRVPHILSLAKEWNVQGAVLVQQKFCDPHELDIPAIKKALEAEGIKTLFLELDVTVPIGQFKIRTEAFLEMMRDDDLF
ncbi:MAG: benzoyl-CoA reductase, bzd-type, subunit N [Planctomycetota bacterium]